MDRAPVVALKPKSVFEFTYIEPKTFRYRRCAVARWDPHKQVLQAAYSQCSTLDNFNKRRGFAIARARLAAIDKQQPGRYGSASDLRLSHPA